MQAEFTTADSYLKYFVFDDFDNKPFFLYISTKVNLKKNNCTNKFYFSSSQTIQQGIIGLLLLLIRF
jgi:hypothetical protein